MAAARRPSRSGAARDRGAAAVEFALVLPLLLLIVFGIIDFSRAYNARIMLTEAASESARALALGANPTQAQNAACAVVSGSPVTCGELTFTFGPACTAASTTTQATARISMTFSLATPLIPTAARQFPIQGVGARTCAS